MKSKVGEFFFFFFFLVVVVVSRGQGDAGLGAENLIRAQVQECGDGHGGRGKGKSDKDNAHHSAGTSQKKTEMRDAGEGREASVRAGAPCAQDKTGACASPNETRWAARLWVGRSALSLSPCPTVFSTIRNPPSFSTEWPHKSHRQKRPHSHPAPCSTHAASSTQMHSRSTNLWEGQQKKSGQTHRRFFHVLLFPFAMDPPAGQWRSWRWLPCDARRRRRRSRGGGTTLRCFPFACHSFPFCLISPLNELLRHSPQAGGRATCCASSTMAHVRSARAAFLSAWMRRTPWPSSFQSLPPPPRSSLRFFLCPVEEEKMEKEKWKYGEREWQMKRCVARRLTGDVFLNFFFLFFFFSFFLSIFFLFFGRWMVAQGHGSD